MFSDILVSLIFTIFSIFLAILGAMIGARLQHRYWIRQNHETNRTERKNAAFSVAHRTLELIDRRINRQRRVLWAIRRGHPEDIEQERIAYKSAIDEWMENLGRLKAELWTSYGKDESDYIGDYIHNLIANNGRKIEEALRLKSKQPLTKIDEELNFISYRSFMFVQDLLSRAHEEKIRGLEDNYKVIYKNWENLSHSYLIARLFGISNYR